MGLREIEFGDLGVHFGLGADDGIPRGEVAGVLGGHGAEQDGRAGVKDDGLAFGDQHLARGGDGRVHESLARSAWTWASSSAMRSASVLMGSAVW